jgi:hypothetical protein
MGKDPTISIRIDQSKKEKWKQEAEENAEYNGLSHLIRLAVTKELGDESASKTVPSSPTETAEINIEADIEAEISDIAAKVDEMHTVLTSLENQTFGSEEIQDTAHQMYELIPDVEAELTDTHLTETGQPSPVARDLIGIASREGLDLSSNIDEQLEEMSESELRSLLPTGLLSVYREYLEISDVSALRVAEKIESDNPTVEIEKTRGIRLIYNKVHEEDV